LTPRIQIKTLFFLYLAFLFTAPQATGQDLPPLWITDSRLGSSLLRIDAKTGGRSVVDLSRYPAVLEIDVGVVSPSGALYLEAVNAAQLSTIIRYDPVTGNVTGISGWVDNDGASERGAGPDLEPGLTAMVIGRWGFLYALRRSAGVMSVDVGTGDRTVISQSTEPAVGGGVEVTDPLDLVFDSRDGILVADRFGGVIRVDRDTGFRATGLVFEDLLEAPHRIERIPDGRLLHTFGFGDGRKITVLDRKLRTARELSGPNRGSGVGFVGIADLVVAPDGLIYVLDIGQRSVLSVDPATGNRRVVAEDSEGADLGQLSRGARFIGYALPSALTRPLAPGRRISP